MKTTKKVTERGAGDRRPAPKRRGETDRGGSLRPERTQLRPERTQARRREKGGGRGGVPAGAAPRALSRRELAARLAELPGWRLAADGRSLSSTVEFEAHSLAVVYLNLVTSLAQLSGFFPEIRMRGARVTLRLRARRRGRLTDDEIGFARALDGAGEMGGGGAGSSTRKGLG